MYLELKDNARAQFPVIDPNTGELLLFNAEAFSALAPVEAESAVNDFPEIIESMRSAGIDENTIIDLQNQALQVIEEANAIQQTRPAQLDTRWSGSFNIEPSPKPWFARPEVLIPGALVLGFGIFMLAKRR